MDELRKQVIQLLELQGTDQASKDCIDAVSDDDNIFHIAGPVNIESVWKRYGGSATVKRFEFLREKLQSMNENELLIYTIISPIKYFSVFVTNDSYILVDLISKPWNQGAFERAKAFYISMSKT